MFMGKKYRFWQKTVLSLFALFMALSLASPALAVAGQDDVSLTLTPYGSAPGASVTASGTAGPGVWVSLKALDSLQNIVVFDAAKANESGNYSLSFVVPAVPDGVLNVVAGYGDNVVMQNLIVDSRGKGNVNGDSSLDVLDIVQTVNIILGKVQPSAGDSYIADVNGDGDVNVLDVVQIINAVLHAH